MRSRLIALNAPGSLSFPISIIIPALPVLLKSSARDSFIVPPVSVPIMIPVVPSPARVYIKIKTWDIIVITPTTIIIMGAIPTTFPQTPPPTIPEKEICFNIRNSVHIVRIGDHDHFRRCCEYNGWRQRKSDTYIYLCHCWNRNGKCQRQKDCSQ